MSEKLTPENHEDDPRSQAVAAENQPQSRKKSIFAKLRGILHREGVVDTSVVWTESAEEYNARIDSTGIPADFSAKEREMVRPAEFTQLAAGAQPDTINYLELLDEAYGKEGDATDGAISQGHTTMHARVIHADPGTQVIHRTERPQQPHQQ